MKPNIGLTDPQRTGAVALLSATLADEYALYTKTRNYHWNVTGPHFNDLHKFFETQYDAIDIKIDEIAELIRTLGERVPASLSVFAKQTRLPETGDAPDSEGMLKNLLADHEAIARNLRGAIQDADEKFDAADVADYFTGLLEEHQKMAWMIRSIAER